MWAEGVQHQDKLEAGRRGIATGFKEKDHHFPPVNFIFHFLLKRG